jgi:hypothetical protein
MYVYTYVILQVCGYGDEYCACDRDFGASFKHRAARDGSAALQQASLHTDTHTHTLARIHTHTHTHTHIHIHTREQARPECFLLCRLALFNACVS